MPVAAPVSARYRPGIRPGMVRPAAGGARRRRIVHFAGCGRRRRPARAGLRAASAERGRRGRPGWASTSVYVECRSWVGRFLPGDFDGFESAALRPRAKNGQLTVVGAGSTGVRSRRVSCRYAAGWRRCCLPFARGRDVHTGLIDFTCPMHPTEHGGVKA